MKKLFIFLTLISLSFPAIAEEEFGYEGFGYDKSIEYKPGKGISIKSKESNLKLSLSGFAKYDMRWFAHEKNRLDEHNFSFKNFRPTLGADYQDWLKIRYSAEFAKKEADTKDAYIDVKFDEQTSLRAGKFKVPFSLEKLISDYDLMFNERSLATNLQPDRDIGAEIKTHFFDEALALQLGIFSGARDGENVLSKYNQYQDAAGRIFAFPFKNDKENPELKNLGFGFAFTAGEKDGNAKDSQLGSYKSDGGIRFFRYSSGVLSDGIHKRFSPQAQYNYGPVRVLAEYILSSQEVKRGTTKSRIDNDGWQLAAGYVITGEDNSFKGVKPENELDIWNNKYGAFELTARYSELDVDDDAFTNGFASLASSSTKARNYTAGLNWYFNEYSGAMFNYDHTSFDGGRTGGDRKPEQIILSRLQFKF